MGFCGSGEFDSGELSALSGPAREPVVSAIAAAQRAVGAGARHLAEAAFHMLRRQQAYRDPTLKCVGATEV